MRLSLLTVPAFAATSLAQACSTTRDPAHPFKDKSFICGRPGTVAYPSRTHDFISPSGDAAGCAARCWSDATCLSFSIQSSDKRCRLFSKSVNEQTYADYNDPDEKYNRYYFEKGCWIKKGDCPIVNGGFETAYPGIDTQDTYYQPWNFYTTGEYYGNGVIENNAAIVASPYGGYFMRVQLRDQEIPNLNQDVTLVPRTNYTLSYAYSVQGLFANGQDPKKISYSIRIYYNGLKINEKVIKATAPPTQWVTCAKGCAPRFLSARTSGKTNIGTISIVVAPSASTPRNTRIVLGFDAVQLKRVV